MSGVSVAYPYFRRSTVGKLGVPAVRQSGVGRAVGPLGFPGREAVSGGLSEKQKGGCLSGDLAFGRREKTTRPQRPFRPWASTCNTR